VKPLWSRNGRELFYIEPGQSQQPGRLMVVPVQTGPTFGHENPRALLAWPYEWGNPGRSYDVSPDGRRFLVVKTLEFDDAQNAPVSTISFVLNWFEELKRLVPAN
jgi:hypothetical protein